MSWASILPQRHRAAWSVGWLAVGLQLAALVAFAIEVHQQVQVLTWSVYLWEAGGVVALVAVGLAVATRPRGSGVEPAMLGVGLTLLIPAIFILLAMGGN